jgi:hypothetical protein
MLLGGYWGYAVAVVVVVVVLVDTTPGPKRPVLFFNYCQTV